MARWAADFVAAAADVNGSVNAAIFGCFMNQGQICMSTERIIVDASFADDFAPKFAARAAKLPAGNPRGHVVSGSLATPGARLPRRGSVARVRGE